MGAVSLTAKQRKFARLAAQGAKLVEAHEQAYGKRPGPRATQVTEASRVAKKPHVQAAIQEFEKELVPVHDLRACKQRMISNIQYLALNCPDMRVRLAASIDLRNYCEERENRERKLLDSAPVNLDHLLSEIASLRDKQPATIELEAVTDSDTEAALRGEGGLRDGDQEPGGSDDES